MSLIFVAITLLIAVSFHEASHAFVAVKLGDDTPKYQGRLTLNPLAHLDIFGTLAIMLVGFGWGKPVQVNANNFRKKRYDMMLVALAGPLANFFLAFCGVAVVAMLFFINPELLFQTTGAISLFLAFLQTFIQINIFLGVFNLLPLPPLDGGNILLGLLPQKMAISTERVLVENGQILFFLLLGIDLFLHIPIITGPVLFLSQYLQLFLYSLFAL